MFESECFCRGCVACFWACGMAMSGLSVCVWCFPLHTWPVSELRLGVHLDRKGEERDGVGLLFRAPSRGTYKVSLPAASAVFWCQKLAWQEWHSRTPHHVARPRPVLCMLNWQLKSLATTSPRPLIRDSPLPWSLYPLPAGNPIVCGILEDCSNCNRGSFISAGPGEGHLEAPLTFIEAVAGLWAEQQELSAAPIGSFWARQDWWAPSAEYRVIPGLSPPPGNYATQVFVKEVVTRSDQRETTFILILVWPVDNRQAISSLLEGQPICAFGGWLWSSLCLCCGAVGKASCFQNALWSYLGKICWSVCHQH